MKKIAGLAAVAAATVGMLSTSTVDAHGIWFAQRAKQLALIYGVGADDLDSVKRLPLIRSVSGYDASWQPVKTSLRVRCSVPFTIFPPCTMLWLVFFDALTSIWRSIP